MKPSFVKWLGLLVLIGLLAWFGRMHNSSDKTVACGSTWGSLPPAQLAPNTPEPGNRLSAVDTEKQKLQTPRLVDLGADKCVPCKMMAPILEELRKEYKGKLKVEFIDVWKNRSAAQNYKLKSIPTQVFYDENGKEFSRHVGFISKEDILKVFSDRGITFNKE